MSPAPEEDGGVIGHQGAGHCGVHGVHPTPQAGSVQSGRVTTLSKTIRCTIATTNSVCQPNFTSTAQHVQNDPAAEF